MFKSSVHKVGKRVKTMAKASPTLSRMVYNAYNTSHFSSLYEHELLLADAGRCDTYAQAIAKCIKPGSTVVDVGTGTGLLAMLAARVEGTHVYAIDHSDFIQTAEKVAKANGLNNITFVKTNSQNFKPDEKVDVILHEQIGDDLFEENMVLNLLDLKKRILKPDGLILPGRFQLFVEPVALHPDFHVPFISELNIHDFDFSVLKKAAQDGGFIPEDYSMRYMSPSGFEHCLSKPVPILDVDLNQIDSADSIAKEIIVDREFTADGNVDGFGIWFNVVFDDEISLSTSPFDRHTHWAHRLYRTPPKMARKGEKMRYTLNIPDLRRALTWGIEIH